MNLVLCSLGNFQKILSNKKRANLRQTKSTIGFLRIAHKYIN